MNVTVVWDEVVQTTLYLRFSGCWTWDDLHGAAEQVRRMVANEAACVDFTDAGPVPLTGSAVANVHLAVRPIQERVGLFVFIGAGSSTISLMTMYANLYRELEHHYAFTGTLDDARRLLAARHAQRPTLQTGS